MQYPLRNEWSIELIRGLAALMVILAHYWSLIGVEPRILKFMFTGVDLFFLHTIESREIEFRFNPAFWSLPPEVEFYLALPLLALWARGFWRFIIMFLVVLIIHFILEYKSSTVINSVNTSTILAFIYLVY